ncbi:MAG TPA: VWA domain-containing protein [Thermoanaerobaculia bacterium]|nr:VWA domain-containing protein [Thermoanaerobaculia bacterium]
MTGPRILLPCLFLSAFAVHGSPAVAQAAPPAAAPQTPPRTTASVELSLTNLDVVVTDAKGNPVHGLLATDFEVLHDGRPVEVTNFSEIRLEGAAVQTPATSAAPAVTTTPVPPATAPAARPRRRVVIFFDRLYLPEPGVRKALFDSLRSLVADTLEEGDDVMIVTWERSVRTVLPFTDDLDALEPALERIERRCARPSSEVGDSALLEWETSWFKSQAADPRVGAGAGGGSETTQEIMARQAFFEMKGKTAALRGLAATLGGVEGRKALVLVTNRFSRFPGLEFLIGSRPDAGEIESAKRRVQDGRKLLEEVTQAANANGVTLYGLFPDAFEGSLLPSAADSPTSSPAWEHPNFDYSNVGGGRGAPAAPARTLPPASGPALGVRRDALLQNEVEALDVVASATGGVALVGSGNVGRLVERVSSDLQSWYSLGYPSRPGTGRTASVSVRVKGRDLTVRARRAIVEKSVEEQMSDRVLAHLFQPDERSRIPISASLVGSTPGKGKHVLRLEVRIPIESLALLPTAKGVQGVFSVFVASVAAEGDFSTVTRLNQPFEIPAKDLETAQAGHYTYELDVVTTGPGARVAIGIWDEKSNEAGFAVVTPPRS